MAKANFLIDNRNAPIFVYRYTDAGPVKAREFRNADDFEAWYRPGKMRSLGATTTAEFTDVLLDMPETAIGTPLPLKDPEIGSGPQSGLPGAQPARARTAASGGTSTGRDGASSGRPGRTASEAAGRGRPDIAARPAAASGGTSTGRRSYMDARHVALLTGAGFEQVQEYPMVFQRGKDRVEVAPPTSGKWSSAWTLNGDRQGRGIATLFRAMSIEWTGR